MGTAEWVAVGVFVMGILFSILGWLLVNKDSQQGKDITAIGHKVESLQRELSDFKLKVSDEYARSHDVKDFTERIFKKLDEITVLLHNKMDRE